MDPIFPPPPIPNSKKHQIPDAMDNRFELIFNERDDAAELAPVAGGGGVVVARADCVEQNAGDDGLRGAASAWPLHRVLHQKETDPYLRYVAHPTTKENHHRHPRCDQNASDEHSARRGERVAVTSIHRHGRRIRAWHTLPPS